MPNPRPRLKDAQGVRRPITLVVHAPFGEPDLTDYREDENEVEFSHRLVRNLFAVAKRGINVVALLDLFDQPTEVVTIKANVEETDEISRTTRWKQDMASRHVLRAFLHDVIGDPQYQGESLVFALEGHGAGYLPTFDPFRLARCKPWEVLPNADKVTLKGKAKPDWGGGVTVGNPGDPVLPMDDNPLPPPSAPYNRACYPISTAELAWAFQEAGLGPGTGRKFSVIHFNNCFNASLELLHTVAKYADYATGCTNYNFFTGGDAYPTVFDKLFGSGDQSTSAEALAKEFADANRAMLDRNGQGERHPTLGSALALSGLDSIASSVGALAHELTQGLRTGSSGLRALRKKSIKAAIGNASKYDTDGNLRLQNPDALMDLKAFVDKVRGVKQFAPTVNESANELFEALKGIYLVGRSGQPWMHEKAVEQKKAEPIHWEFENRTDLALNIFLPDPGLVGVWDWRSPFFMTSTQPSALKGAQTMVIDFLKDGRWVEFVAELHKGVAFKKLLAPTIPQYPWFKRP